MKAEWRSNQIKIAFDQNRIQCHCFWCVGKQWINRRREYLMNVRVQISLATAFVDDINFFWFFDIDKSNFISIKIIVNSTCFEAKKDADNGQEKTMKFHSIWNQSNWNRSRPKDNVTNVVRNWRWQRSKCEKWRRFSISIWFSVRSSCLLIFVW